VINRRSGLALEGIGLATVFFLPIAAAGQVDAPLMMWAPRHSVELLCAWLAVSAAATGVLTWLRHDHHPRREAALLAALAVPSALSLLAVTGRSAPEVAGELQSILMVTLVAGGLVTAVAALLWWMKPVWLVRTLRTVFMFGVLLIAPAAMSVSALLPATAASSGEAPFTAAASGRCGDVLVLLFDELAHDAVFSGDRSTMGSLASLAASARVYHRASSATLSTRTSIANYLSAPTNRSGSRDIVATGPIGLARRLGMHTDVIGWYFPYCEMLGAYAERCRSFSMYNVATLYDHFAPWAPIETVLNIWPYQLPTGFVKRPAAVHLQTAELEALTREATRPPEARPVLRWVHFNVPHVPWLRDTGPFAYHAFLNTQDRYVKQLDEVDRTLAAVVASLKDRGDLDHTTVVVTSDHGSRQGHAGADFHHVPLVVYSPGGTRQDLYEPVQVADILKSVVAGACRAAE
jgi:hypothetical protein